VLDLSASERVVLTSDNASGISLQGGHFAGNHDGDANGGSISMSGATLDIEDTAFINNAALSGGAVYISDGTIVSFRSCDFWSNNVTEQGGALLLSPAALRAFNSAVSSRIRPRL
jgi:hypothetical protein